MDLINRQDVLDYIDTMPSELTSDGRRMIRRVRLTEYIADTLPSAERKGKWISYIDDGFVECPFCGSMTNCDSTEEMETLHYCFNCGADMRGEEE